MTFILKLLKTIFSRVFAIALSVIMQVAIIVFLMEEMAASYLYFQAALSVLGLLIFVGLVNKKMNPEHKMIWAFLVIVFPLLGILLYFILWLNSPKKRNIRKYTTFDKNIIKQEGSYKEDVYKISNKFEGQFKYIENTSALNAYKNSKCTYLKSGTEFYDSLIKDLKNAKEFIFMEYFIINHGKMWDSILEILKEKVKEGVEVRFIYDDLGSAKYVRGNYYKKLQSYGIKCHKYNTMIPLVSSYHNNRDHRKITVIDGYISYTGGINLSDEYMNITSPFGHWKDNAVRIEGEATNNFTILFLQSYALACREKQDFNKYLYNKEKHPIIESEEILLPFGTGPSNMYYENMANDVFLHLINQAKRSIDISTPYLVIDYALTNALIAASARGVKVRILIPSIPDKKLVYAFARDTAHDLSSYGIEIYTYTPGFNHAKSFLVDDEIAFVGTTNLDFRSLLHHYECGVLIYNSPCLKDIDANFEDDYLKSKLMSEKELRSNVIVKLVLSFLKVFQSLL